MSGGGEEIMNEATIMVADVLENRDALLILEDIGEAAMEAGDAEALERLASAKTADILGADLKIPTPEEMAAGGSNLLKGGKGGGGNLLRGAEDAIRGINEDGFQTMEVVRDVPQAEEELKNAFFRNDGAAPAVEPVDAPPRDGYGKVAGGQQGGATDAVDSSGRPLRFDPDTGKPTQDSPYDDAFRDELVADRLGDGRIRGFGGGADPEPEPSGDLLQDSHAPDHEPDNLGSLSDWMVDNPTGTREQFAELQKAKRGIPRLDTGTDGNPLINDGIGDGIESDGLLVGDGMGRPVLDQAGSSNKLKLALIGAAVVAAGGVAIAGGAGAFDKEKSDNIDKEGKQPDQGHDVNNPDGHSHTEGPAEQNNDPNHPDDPSHPGNNGTGQNGGQPKQDWGELGPDGAVESDIWKEAISAAEKEAEGEIQQSKWGILPMLIAGVAIANI